MDLQPPPPLFRHHQNHHFRYENVLRPPDFIPSRYSHQLLPPPPPRPPPIILPPPPPPPPPMRHIAYPALPPRFTFSPPHHSIPERSRLYEFDPPPKPYFHGTFVRPPPPPPPREHIPLRIIHDYPERNPMFEDDIFRRGCVGNHIPGLPEIWDRNLRWGGRELHTSFADIDIGDHARHSDIVCPSRELYKKRDEGKRWDSRISDWGHDLHNKRDYETRRWDSCSNDRSRELYSERGDDERRWDTGINDRGRELYSERDNDERRWDNGINDRGCELYGEGDDDERKWDSSKPGGVLSRLGNREQEDMVDDLSFGRFSGRLQMVASKGEFNRSNKKRRLHKKKKTLHRIQLRKDCSKHSGRRKCQFARDSSRGSFKGKGKGFERLQTRTENKREREQSPLELAILFKSNALIAKAILASSHPAVESDVKCVSSEERLASDMSGSASVKSSKDVVRPKSPNLLTCRLKFQSESQGTSKDLLDRAAVSENGSVTAKDASDFGGSAMENAHLKVMNLQGPTKRRKRLSQLRKKRRARKHILREANVQMEKGNEDSKNEKDCINSLVAVSQHNSETALPYGNRSSAFFGVIPCPLPSFQDTVSEKTGVTPFVPTPKRKRSSLNTAPASSYVADNAISVCSGHAERLMTTTDDADHVHQLITDEVAGHVHENLLAHENTDHGDSLSFSQHVNNVDKFLHDSAFVLGAEKVAIESIDRCTRMDSDRVDDINEHTVLGPLVMLESPIKGPSEVTLSTEGHDTAGLSRPQGKRIAMVHEDKSFSEIHKAIAKSDCAPMQQRDDVTISDVGSKIAYSKELFPNQVNAPQIGVHAKESRNLECAAVADCSNVGLGISIGSGSLSADHKGVTPQVGNSFPGVSRTNLPHNVDSVEGSVEVINNVEACLSVDSSKTIRKRKARGAEMSLCGTKTNVFVGTVRSTGGEVARCLADDLVPHVEVDFLGEKDSSKEDASLKEGPLAVEDSTREVDFGANSSFPGYQKKRKLSSARSSLTALWEDDTIADGLTSDFPILDQRYVRLAEWGAEQREDTPSVCAAINKCGTTDVEGKVGNENNYIGNLDENLADRNKLHWNDDMSLVANSISLCAERNGGCASSSGNELFAAGFDMRSCMSSPEQLLAYSDLSFSRDTEAPACLSENEMIYGRVNMSSKKPVSGDHRTCSLGKSLEAAPNNSPTNADIPSSLLGDTSQMVKKSSSAHGKLTWCRNQPTSAVPKVFSGHHPSNFSNSRKFHATHATKSRTWHRTGNCSDAVAEPKLRLPPIPQSHGTEVARTVRSSYTRKGNSLVRNPSLSGVTPPGFHGSSCSSYRLTPCTDSMKNNNASVCEIGDADPPTLKNVEQVNTSEMIKSLTLNNSGKSLSCTNCNLGESSLVGNPPTDGCPCKISNALEERIQSSAAPECRIEPVNNSDSQSTLEEGNPDKKIMYVKRRSNQLIATCNSDDTSILGVVKNQASLSDGYYKRRKNQLVRASSENHDNRGDANVTECQLVSPSILPKTSNRRQSVFAKTARYSKLSFVWKLHDTQALEKHNNSSGPQKFWPLLFSPKGAAHRRSLILGTKLNNRPFSILSQKLLLSRKRGAIYTRSTHGYSLRMSKVLSVGGSSLKWSKSIERNSKKANEEATRAVAAAEKNKKEGKGAATVASKIRNHVSRKLVLSVKLHPGERIFRIGSERYKMDPTRRTLHRITAEKEPASLVTFQSEKNVKRSYVPRRLLIGNDEYVRIGNGNQLVRDPKKRTRILASEKVRWSLRTARLRLARKRKYCQFFTRFGKCNKDDGKCPYIHDPSKIVVCTKFLTGSCSNVDCKLTHKVIPERMQDCSYFLKGSCSNDNCPYRHVNINPDSTVCESFLRGYCADGNECRKKHTYVCPAFEATGNCPQASTCKLHHPKKKIELKPTSEQKIVRGRYFDGGLIGVADCSTATTEKLSGKDKDDIACHEGNYPDYISLDVSDDEEDHTLVAEQVCDDILPDAQTAVSWRA